MPKPILSGVFFFQNLIVSIHLGFMSSSFVSFENDHTVIVKIYQDFKADIWYMYNHRSFQTNPRFLDQFLKKWQTVKVSYFQITYSYEKDNFPLDVTTHLIFFWPATIQYSKLKFGVTKSADLDLHRSFFRNLDLETEICWFLMLQLTWDTL